MLKAGGFTINEKSGRIRKVCLDVTVQNKAGYRLTGLPAIIDTGTTYTCVSRRVINQLNLTPREMVTARTASGKKEIKRYVATIELTPQIIFSKLTVYSFIGYEDLDVLIGMDIITAGDFAVTEDNGNTVVSYRTPHSTEPVDFMKL